MSYLIRAAVLHVFISHKPGRLRHSKLIPMRLKNYKRKGMPFYTLSHHLHSPMHTYTLRLSILHEGLELLLPEFQTAVFVKVSCQRVPYCCRVKMLTFVEINCVELLPGSRVEVSSYSRDSVLLKCGKRLLSF